MLEGCHFIDNCSFFLSFQNVTCQICKTNMTGITPAEAHLLGSKHKKVVQEFKLNAAVGQNYDRLNSSISGKFEAFQSHICIIFMYYYFSKLLATWFLEGIPSHRNMEVLVQK